MIHRSAVVSVIIGTVLGIDNGVALTPPRGWMSWQRYRCSIACNDATSDNCVNERLIKDVADQIVAGGFKYAGYEYVAIDDCWMAPHRVNGHIVADPNRFPSGIKALVDYVHSKGLKFSLYTAMGNFSCAQYYPHYQVDPSGLSCDYDQIAAGCPLAKLDIEDFVSWGIDHLKVDGCLGFDKAHMNHSYALVGDYLRAAASRRGGLPVVYHPSNLGFQFPRQFRELAAISNHWRFFSDANDHWPSTVAVIEELGAGQPACRPGALPPNCTGFQDNAMSTYCASFCSERDAFLGIAGRGGWHDLDAMIVGNSPCDPKFTKVPYRMHCGQLSHEEEQTQMALWAMASTPLFMSNDIRNISRSSRAILLNREVLAINDDHLGRMPFRFYVDDSDVHIWRKELVGGSVALAIVNLHDTQWIPVGFGVSLRDTGFAPQTHVAARDLYSGKDLGWYVGQFVVDEPIAPHGVQLLRLSFSPQSTRAHALEI